jgi:2'-5' RNA ligase
VKLIIILKGWPMRVLVGIPVEDVVAEPLQELADSTLFKNSMRLSRMEPHITLKAPQEVDNISEWQQKAMRACRDAKRSSVQATSIGFLTPFTFCIFLKCPELHALQYKVADALTQYNHPDVGLYEKELFNAHITLGRTAIKLDKVAENQLIELARRTFRPLPQFEVNTIRLYGQVTPPEYSALADINLSDNS